MISANRDVREEFGIRTPDDVIWLMNHNEQKFRYICKLISADDLIEDAINYIAPGWAKTAATGAYRFVKNWWNGKSEDKPPAVLPDPIAAGQTEGIK